MKERKYIEKNRDLFDDMEPAAGHMERFEALLKQQNEQVNPKKKPVRKIRMISIMSVAASIAILVVVAIKMRTPEHIQAVPGQENIITNDFQKMNAYYNQQMQEQISDIMCKLAYTDHEDQALLTEDLQKIIEENTGFVDEMSKNEDKELAIYYLQKHYKANIQVLEDINEKLGKYTNC